MISDKLQTQYQSAQNLTARVNLHRKWSTNPYGWQRWVFDRLLANLPASAKILEVGCGRCDLWKENAERIPTDWQVTLSDQSTGMLEDGQANLGNSLSARFIFVQLNIETAVLQQGEYDALIANHMIYHLADRPRALRNMRAMLSQDGVLFATTNGKGHLAPFREDPIVSIVYPDGLPDNKIFYMEGRGDWFHLEDGADLLKTVLSNVACDVYEDGLDVGDVEDLVAFHRSYAEIGEDQERRLAKVYETMRQDGVIRIPKAVGMFVSRG